MRKRWGESFNFMSDNQFRSWERKVRLKHKFGIHTYVPLEEWTDESVRLVGDVCWKCDVRM